MAPEYTALAGPRAHWTETASLAMPVIMCTAGFVPAVLAIAGGAFTTQIPAPLWFVLCAVYLVALSLCTFAFPRVPWPWPLVALAATCLTALAIVTTAPEAQWLAMVLICAVIACSYLVPLWATVAVIVVNTGVLTAAGFLRELNGAAVITGALIYMVIQFSAVISVRLVIRESTLRRELLVAHNNLRATQDLLEEGSRAQERLRISRDLHDLLGHRLTALSLELEAAGHLSEGPPRQHVVRAREMARELLSDVRMTVGSIRAKDDPVPLVLADLVKGLDEPIVHLNTNLPDALDSTLATVVVRTVQEGVTNAIRHADAQRLWIDAVATDGRIDLAIRDDGVGVKEIVPGNGLVGMRERVEALGGEIEFRSERGFSITGWVPA